MAQKKKAPKTFEQRRSDAIGALFGGVVITILGIVIRYFGELYGGRIWSEGVGRQPSIDSGTILWIATGVTITIIGIVLAIRLLFIKTK